MYNDLSLRSSTCRFGSGIPAGTYHVDEWSLSYRSDPSRRVYGRLRYSPQGGYGFYDSAWRRHRQLVVKMTCLLSS